MKYTLLTLLLITLTVSAQKYEQKIAINYYDKVDQQLKDQLIEAIAQSYHAMVFEVSGVDALPKAAYYAPRHRYRAEVILKDMSKYNSAKNKLLGITTRDISTTHNGYYDWGIMGLANQPGFNAIISTYRLKNVNKQMFYDRIIKVSLHELGHTMGLPHCTYSKTCYMQDAAGTVLTLDRSNRRLCNHCYNLLNR